MGFDYWKSLRLCVKRFSKELECDYILFFVDIKSVLINAFFINYLILKVKFLVRGVSSKG